MSPSTDKTDCEICKEDKGELPLTACSGSCGKQFHVSCLHKHSTIGYTDEDSERGSLFCEDCEAENNGVFADREGKVLTWTNVNMTVKGTGKDKEDKHILQKVWGEVPKRKTTAVMGASGSGKTSLLNILAGRMQQSSNIKVDADIRLDNVSVDPSNIKVRQAIAFVAQFDSIQPTATPREAIRFSAKLRLPKTTTEEELDSIANRMLEELGLTKIANTIIGSERRKGVSGGEKKRVSVAVELVTRPSVVLLDEPTSGLDSFSAAQLIQVLRKIANAGTSVLFTVHQPNPHIYATFDHLIVMNKGRIMYQGEADKLSDHLAMRGYPVPEDFSRSDWVMHIAQTKSSEELENENLLMNETRDLEKPISFNDGKEMLGLTKGFRDNNAAPGFAVQIQEVFGRELTNLRRDKASFMARLAITIFFGSMFAAIFAGVGESDPAERGNVQSRFGALVMVAQSTMFASATPFVIAFPEERPRFLREFSSKHYGVAPYFLSKLFLEFFMTGIQNFLMVTLTYFAIGFQSSFGVFFFASYALGMVCTAFGVFLGCSLSDPAIANELLPLIFTPQLLFSGFIVSFDLIPVWLRWIRYICVMTYALWILCLEEFRDCSGSEQGEQNCQDLLNDIDANEDSKWLYWVILIGLFAVLRSLALFVLRQKAKRYD